MDFELTPDQQDLQQRARDLARTVFAARAPEIDKSEQYPWDNVKALNEAGFMGMTIPREYGGQGRSFLDAVLVIEEMAQVCGVTARIVVEANMGAISTIMRYGTEAQKRMAAEVLFSRADKPAICITEPDAGSAATEMTTRADRRGDTWVLNGKKHWITGGGVSRLHLIFARVFRRGRHRARHRRLPRRARRDEGAPHRQARADHGPARHPRDRGHLRGHGGRRGRACHAARRPAQRGFADLMNAYNCQRVGAATVALGIAEGAYELALAYAQKREQFGRPIAEFQGLQWMLADMDSQIEAARALIYKAAASAERNNSGFPTASWPRRPRSSPPKWRSR